MTEEGAVEDALIKRAGRWALVLGQSWCGLCGLCIGV